MSGLEFNPYIIPGRWYKVMVESDGTDITITTDDLGGCSISGTSLVVPANFHILSFMHDIHTEGGELTSAQTIASALRVYADGKQGIQLGNAKCADYADIYLFGHYVES